MKTDLVVAGFLINDERALLVHHKKSGLWLPVGGHIDENETPDNALKREFKEEVNIDVKILNRNDIPENERIIEQLAVPFYVNVHNVGDHNHCCFFYLCRPKNPKKININKDELHGFAWFSKKDLRQGHVSVDVRNIALKAFEIFEKLEK